MKKIMLGLLGVVLLTGAGASVSVSAANAKVLASRAWSQVTMEGTYADLKGYTIANSTYYRLRDVAELFSGTSSQFQVRWNEEQRKVEILNGQAYAGEPGQAKPSVKYENYAQKTNADILIDGRPVLVDAYQIEGSTYFRLRDLARLTDFNLRYDSIEDRIELSARLPEGAYSLQSAYPVSTQYQSSSEFSRWKEPTHTYLLADSEGTTRSVFGNDSRSALTVETYSADHKLQKSEAIPYELPIFGGFFSGSNYHYAVYGQINTEENDAKEVIRIVRYDKSFKRIDSVSVTGGQSYTVSPFQSGSLRMAEQGDTLVVHTARKRYTTDDGLNHQSQLTIIINTSTMTVSNDLGRFQKNHVSHSFDQYVTFDGNEHVLVDHGDAYPRSIVLHKGNGTSYQEVDLFDIPGSTGANVTGVSIGGFEATTSDYLVAWNSVDHSKVRGYTSFELVGMELDQRDIKLSALPKTTLNESAVREVTLATYSGTDRIGSVPKLIELSGNRLMVLWQEYDLNGKIGDLKYVRIDEQGTPVEPVRSMPYYRLGEGQPVLNGEQVIWYADSVSGRALYTLPAFE